MSGYQHKEGAGSLFVNNKSADNQPDMKGDAMFNGAIVEVAAWKRTTGAGKEFLSLKIQLKREQPSRTDDRDPPQRQAPKQAGGGKRDSLDDEEIPF